MCSTRELLELSFSFSAPDRLQFGRIFKEFALILYKEENLVKKYFQFEVKVDVSEDALYTFEGANVLLIHTVS